MIIRCPRCQARYRVPDDEAEGDPTFKCSRCDHLFSAADAGLARTPAPPRPRPRPPEAESLSFSFEVSAPEPEEEEREAAENREEAPEEAAEPDLFEADEAPRLEDDDPASSPNEEDESDDEEPDFEEDEPRFVTTAPAFSARPRSTPYVRTATLVFLGTLLLVYANLALYLGNHPEETDASLSSLPVIGSLFADDRALQTLVDLSEVHGVRHRIKGGREAFVVSGRTTNAADTPIRSILVTGTIYGPSGDPVGSQTSYCGNAVSLKIIENLSPREITILQGLQPAKRFEIEPGAGAGFTIVFLDPPAEVAEFGVEVTSARPADA